VFATKQIRHKPSQAREEKREIASSLLEQYPKSSDSAREEAFERSTVAELFKMSPTRLAQAGNENQ